MRKNSSFTQTQLFVVVGLAIAILGIFSVAIVYLFVENNPSIIIATPTNLVLRTNALIPPTHSIPTTTLIPTFVYNPTFTPIPSPTSFVLAPNGRPTSIAQQLQNNPAPTNPPANPPAVKPAANCSPQLDYAAAMHQYNLDSIDAIHSPMINYYQSLIDEATQSRDALGLVQAQRALAAEQAQMNAEKSAENRRYKAERASINANCQ